MTSSPSMLDRARRSARSAGSGSRTSVDLPEPDRPMTTKTSPGATSKETSLTADDAAGLLLQLRAATGRRRACR